MNDTTPDSYKDIIFLINPNSGTTNADKLIDSIRQTSSELNYFICATKACLIPFFENEAPKYKYLIICGGDGTVNSVLPFVKELDIVLGILPRGSGDGFARELGFNNHLRKLLSAIQKRKTQFVDLLNINDGYYAINLVGSGLDSHITHLFEKQKKRGFLSYIKVSLAAFLNYKPYYYHIQLDNESVEGVFMMVCIANTRQFGNNAFIAPNANYSDGKLEVVLLKKPPLWKVPVILFCLFNKKIYLHYNYVQFFTTKTIEIKSEVPHFHTDGECREMNKKLTIRIEKQLRFIKL